MFYFITDQYNAIFEEVGKNVVALATRGRSTSEFFKLLFYFYEYFSLGKKISFFKHEVF